MQVCLNGQMLPYDEAQLAHDDAAVQHGVGLFETMMATGGRVFRLDAHLQRLEQSCRELGLAGTIDTHELAQAVGRTLDRNKLAEARVRLTLSPGRVNLLRPEINEPAPLTVLCVASELVHYDPAYFQQGVTVQIAGPLANPFDPSCGHKTLNYWMRLRLLRQAADVGAAEAIILNVTNHLAGGAISNLFLVKNASLMTPYARGEEASGALPAPVLPGITRGAIIELAQSANIPVHRRMLSVGDLLDADEVFLTNSSWNLLPVTRVEKKQIAGGAIGPLSQQLRTSLLQQIAQETR